MPAMTVPKDGIARDAGYLLYAPLLTALPTNTVVGSIFTDSWPGGWVLLGVTRDGHEFDSATSTDIIEAAEYYDPLQVVTTGRQVGMKFELMRVNVNNWKRMNNGGTLNQSGSGTTLLSTYQPPQPGGESRCMIGWEAQDSTERLVMEQCFQVGALTVMRKKGSANASFANGEFRAEIPASGFPYQYWTAGAVRGT
jgi:hypothetical protein